MAEKWKRWPKFDPNPNKNYPNGLNIDYEELADIKVKALKQCLHTWGGIIKKALQEETGLEASSQLFNSFHFRVEPQRQRDINGRVRLLVGVLDKNSPVLKYLKFFVYGTRKHFVPITYRGRSTGILKWAQKKGVIARRGNVWYWTAGTLSGKKFRGAPNFGNTANNFFKRVYERYYRQIQRDIRQILEGE